MECLVLLNNRILINSLHFDNDDINLKNIFYQAVVLEGKYWKRKLAAVTAEYKKWRMFYRNKILGWTNKDGTEMVFYL